MDFWRVPGQNTDTYIEIVHRHFFERLAEGAPAQNPTAAGSNSAAACSAERSASAARDRAADAIAQGVRCAAAFL